ncbi:hypothetical protein K4K49_002453 [Colletotrichum sp. SAR 10_70]|nr:hypothetical protein K4K50_001947 [Colletotrichum sp. SAR 10_71]KAI8175972.1 hypothetical protein K4K49_002453 [Colletotrichum sp. SAR 10_70]KAI8179769.1 hypothetical protein K4K51_003239 [Colletotrichum sp. SAR 10_75]KAI8182060.1 hypothetical protein KHU50_002458 [Colletotrichum sp. SAR 10_65]KAJ5000543.1 hypothetical protein K4K48_002569 [Colletotrichum sp. SAR 10_66]
MQLKHLVTGLAVFSSLAAAAPATAPAQDAKAADKDAQKQDQNKDQNKNNKNNNNGKNNNNNNKNNGDVTIIQNIIKPNIIVVQENLDKINQLQRQNERELALLVQSQLALATQLQAVKDNIRINHFKAQFPQANTIIVTVTGLVDNRQGGGQNKRYLVNQLLADNGKPGQQALVMVNDPTPMDISTQQAASSQSDTFGAARVALDSASDAVSNNTDGVQAAAAPTPGADESDTTLKLAAFDQAAPFGQVGQSIILPAGTQAPQLAASVPDPAAIILPNQAGLFVSNAATFLTDCASTAANAAAGNPALAGAALNIFSSFQQIAAAQLAGLSGLGIFNNAGQVQGQPLGAIAVGANQPAAAAPPAVAPPAVAPPAAAPPAAASPPPAAAAPPAQGGSLGAIAVGANQGQPAAAPAPPTDAAAAPQPPAAVLVGANQAQPAAASPLPPQGSSGSGVVIVGSSPGGAPAPAAQPAAQPPAAVLDGANQAPANPPAVAPAPAPAA